MKFLYLSIALLLYSCSFDAIKNQGHLNYVEKNITQCDIEKNEVRLLIDNPLLKTQFKEYVNDHKISNKQQYILLSLIQLVSHQESTNLNSKIVTIIVRNGRQKVLSYTPTPEGQSYINYLNDLAQIHNISKSDLLKLIKNIDLSYPRKIPISKELSNFLELNKNEFAKIENIREYTFRGSQILREGESLRRPIFSDILKLNSKNDPLVLTNIFNSFGEYQCSFDPRLFSNKPLLQHKQEKINSNIFGIINDKNNYVITLTSASPKIEIYSKRLNIFKSLQVSHFNAAICFNKESFVISKNSNYSEQIISNALENIQSLETDAMIKEMLMKKRFLNLIYPERRVVEVFGVEKKDINSSTSSQKNETYYLPSIGNLDVIVFDKTNYIFNDPRRDLSKCN